MNVVLLTRFPRVDTAAWKQELARRLVDSDAHLTVAYTRSGLLDHARAGMIEFAAGAIRRYRDAQAGPEPTGTLARWAADRGVEVLRHRRIDDARLHDELAKRKPDVVVLAGADIVPESLLAIPAAATINPHYGLLPAYRGMSVAEWSIFNDDPVGVSVHFVDAGIDTGDVIVTRPLGVDADDELITIRQKQRAAAVELLDEAIQAIAAGTVARTPQSRADGRQYYRMHPALRRHVEDKLASGRYRWLGRDLPKSATDAYA